MASTGYFRRIPVIYVPRKRQQGRIFPLHARLKGIVTIRTFIENVSGILEIEKEKERVFFGLKVEGGSYCLARHRTIRVENKGRKDETILGAVGVCISCCRVPQGF